MTDAGALTVLVVEDDPRMRAILERHLDRMGYEVRGASGGGEALAALEAAPADVVLSDVRMPGMDGRTLLQIVRERYPETKVVLMTAFGSVDDAVEAMQAGAYTYIVKPFKVDEVAVVLRNAARELHLGRKVARLEKTLGGRFSADRLIGRSPRLEEVRRIIREAAQVTSTVLVTGPSGTGKELAARAIHHEGPRASGEFVPVNCAALPDSLFEASLFGHKRGAFTGATDDMVGFVERSSGGTLFLDEVGDIPLAQQAGLLRVLQEGEVTPVGAAKPVKVDLRVVCATNRDLGRLVAEGRFREDLYYRIHVLTLEMPPLSERPEDIPPLAEHLLSEIVRERGTAALGFTEAALEALRRRPWPGNVRELRNALERALLLARGRRIDAADLPGASGAGAAAPVAAAAAPDDDAPLGSLADVERAHIARVLERCEWNRSAAAKILGIDRRTLFSKIRRYGLD